MAKAKISLPGEIDVHVEGTAEEITRVVELLKGHKTPSPSAPSRSKTAVAEKTQRTARQKVQLVDLVGNLIDGGFFKTPKDLASVKQALEEMGHHYPVTTLSGTMLDQVRKRHLRRLKKDKRWMYTG